MHDPIRRTNQTARISLQ